MSSTAAVPSTTDSSRVDHIRGAMPQGGMFQGKEWRVSPQAFPLPAELLETIGRLGPACLAFQRACNRLYHQSSAGGEHEWVARLLDQGKPNRMVSLGRHERWRDDVPRVIRPDLILTEMGVSIVELDNLPGGIGTTAWLGETYAALEENIVGGSDGMLRGFGSAFPAHDVLVSRESEGYQPEMEWLCDRLNVIEGGARQVLNPWSTPPLELAGRSLYRFFELWDVENVEHSAELLTMARNGDVALSPPPKPFLEEKLWLALFWSPALRDWWDAELSSEHLSLLRKCIPYGWVLDPVTLPLHAEWPQLGIHSWQDMNRSGNKERELVIKVSGWSEKSWGSRGVKIGHDLPQAEWSAAIDEALLAFPTNPHLMQRFHRARVVRHPMWDEAKQATTMLQSRVRLCPYYFVTGQDVALGGVLATIVPADKKILHGMSEAMLVPCSSGS